MSFREVAGEVVLWTGVAAGIAGIAKLFHDYRSIHHPRGNKKLPSLQSPETKALADEAAKRREITKRAIKSIRQEVFHN